MCQIVIKVTDNPPMISISENGVPEHEWARDETFFSDNTVHPDEDSLDYKWWIAHEVLPVSAEKMDSQQADLPRHMFERWYGVGLSGVSGPKIREWSYGCWHHKGCFECHRAKSWCVCRLSM